MGKPPGNAFPAIPPAHRLFLPPINYPAGAGIRRPFAQPLYGAAGSNGKRPAAAANGQRLWQQTKIHALAIKDKR